MTLTFDLDAVDDATHGLQQLTLFHGFYEQYQYLPLVITSAQTDQVVMISLRHGTATASLGADDDLEYIVNRVRAAWPGVQIRVRGDAGFGNPTMYEMCERLEITYTFGLSTNAVLKRESEDLLAEAVRLWEQTGQEQRLFQGFWYVRVPGVCPAGWWSRPKPMLRERTGVSWSPIAWVLPSIRKQRMTNTPCVGKVKTATRNSSATFVWID